MYILDKESSKSEDNHIVKKSEECTNRLFMLQCVHDIVKIQRLLVWWESRCVYVNSMRHYSPANNWQHSSLG